MQHSSHAPDDVLNELRDGNRRFVLGQTEDPRRKPQHFKPLAAGQHPMAVIVGCADSRVPPEIVFDQGIGDLFVVRVAGNVVCSTVAGSIEYAVAELHVPVIMVLGHAKCGAVHAAIAHFDNPDAVPGAIKGLVHKIKPAVAKTKGQAGDPMDNAIKANVKMGVEHLLSLGPILSTAVKEGKLKVVGGVYDISTGTVTIIE